MLNLHQNILGMLRVKKLYQFILQRFLPLFMMTFFICLFIVLMQFLWRHIDDLVGKGLAINVICELFFYAALTMVPLALPLAILLASLMVFGNLGEKLELTAMKAAGVSLFKIMSPLIVFVSMVSVGAFFFQNNVLPKAQVKMWTLLFSMRQKSPELEIPEGVFYDQIEGYNIFVKQKNPENGHLYNMMIYDVSQGYGTANIIVADSGKLSFADDKQHLLLNLRSGESFEDLKHSRASERRMLYRRETFKSKDILIPFDANFNRMDDDVLSNQYIGKNISELRATIDSVNCRIDSIGTLYAGQLKATPYVGIPAVKKVYKDGKYIDVINQEVKLDKPLDIDTLFNGGDFSSRRQCVSGALSRAKQTKQDYEFKGYVIADERKSIRRHDIELQKKFTLAIACIIFFFIGAPLGSIIKKGGLAVPIVVSVILFVFYYIIDNSGLRLAKEGIWPVWQGLWLSTAVLSPIGVFFTYKAVNDSAVFNADAYVIFFRKLIGRAEVRNVEMKDIVMDDMSKSEAIDRTNKLICLCNEFLSAHKKRQRFYEYWTQGYSASEVRTVSETLESLVEYISNSKDILVVHRLSDYPILRKLLLYQPFRNQKLGKIAMFAIPLSVPVYLIGINQQKILKQDINKVVNVSKELITLLQKDNNDIE